MNVFISNAIYTDPHLDVGEVRVYVELARHADPETREIRGWGRGFLAERAAAARMTMHEFSSGMTRLRDFGYLAYLSRETPAQRLVEPDFRPARRETWIPGAWLNDPRLTGEQLAMLKRLASYPDGHVFEVLDVTGRKVDQEYFTALSALGALKMRGYLLWDEPDRFTLCPRTSERPKDVQ